MNDDQPLTNGLGAQELEAPSVAASGVQLQIGELVLRGFPPDRRYAIAEACQRELERLLTASPRVDRALGSSKTPLAASARFDAMSSPERIGNAIAQAVAARLR
jgi:hypothetical protein